jgi:hypothetical protein
MNSSFVPLGTQAGLNAEDRSPDLRLIQPPSQQRILEIRHQWFNGVFSLHQRLRLTSCPSPNTTGSKAVALTVAGQWRTFTAFPSILAIAVISRAAIYTQPKRHETVFHDINIYNRRHPLESKPTRLEYRMSGLLLEEDSSAFPTMFLQLSYPG